MSDGKTDQEIDSLQFSEERAEPEGNTLYYIPISLHSNLHL